MFSDMETIDREYKETFGDPVLKAICAMANTKGGAVFWHFRSISTKKVNTGHYL